MAIKVKDAWLQVRIDGETLARFRASCDERGRSVSSLVRSWIVADVAAAEKRSLAASRPVGGAETSPADAKRVAGLVEGPGGLIDVDARRRERNKRRKLEKR